MRRLIAGRGDGDDRDRLDNFVKLLLLDCRQLAVVQWLLVRAYQVHRGDTEPVEGQPTQGESTGGAVHVGEARRPGRGDVYVHLGALQEKIHILHLAGRDRLVVCWLQNM